MAKFTDIKIKDDFITLGQFLKYANIIQNGGEVKLFLQNEEVFVNNEPENRRGRKLYKNDLIKVLGEEYRIC